jgi:uncharacterized protein with HEPN domain
MNSRDAQIVRKAMSEIDYLADSVEGLSFDDFDKNETLKRAAAMTLINIGEVFRLVSDDFRNEHPELPIREISATRNVAAHGYQTLRFDDIWDTIINDLPVLSRQLKDLIG